MIYRKEKTREISFPLGGIGTGCIGLAGNGALIDWEIFNRPNKQSYHGFSHFAVKAEAEKKVLDAKVLVADLSPPYVGQLSGHYSGFGWGPSRYTMQGLPHFRDCEFVGEFPFATVRFRDKTFPGRVEETAFNPFIPLNDKDSSIPAAFFLFTLTNTTKKKITYTISGMLKNRQGEKTVHKLHRRDGISLLHLASEQVPADHVDYGDLAIATDAEDTSFQCYSYRGVSWWFHTLGVYWKDFTTPGKYVDRVLPPSDNAGHDEHGILAAHVTLKPGQSRQIRFLIGWHYPNMNNYWNPEPCECQDRCKPRTWKNYYTTLFRDSADTVWYGLRNWDPLYGRTKAFKEALFSSTLPPFVLDAVSANLSILKSPTVLRLEDGSLYGFEGCHGNAGCCEGTCTHVWNYAYAAPFLFPNLERSMRDLEYRHTMRDDGKMGFRLQLPVGRAFQDWHACADGQFGGVIKSYREWKLSGDDAWLKSNWPAIKKSIEFAWAPTNEDQWDLDKDGVLEGRQHHTLDTELFGPNSYLTGFYLAALKAGADMAEYLGEPEKAKEYRGLFEKGKAWVDKNLFNGEYYHQKINLKDKSVLDPYREFDDRFGSVEAFYWSKEHGELSHQIATGCHCDQVIAQWHANLVGLGDIFDRSKVRKALQSIYRYNFKKAVRAFANPCRLYAVNDEAALVICDWPKGDKPACPLSYAEEAMNGYEYQAAIHMIQEGLVKEGLTVVRAIRDRYDGEKRNPWNEFECGSNYARSMASFALLPALAGFRFDGVKEYLGFAPAVKGKNFSCFWSVDGAWGTYRRSGRKIALHVAEGQLRLRRFSDPRIAAAGKIAAGGREFKREGPMIEFAAPVVIAAGESLRIEV
jgi:non-lysosomal glucosylceramidase